MNEFVNAAVFVLFLAVTVFGGVRLGLALVAADRLVDDALKERQ
jgi:hypothetical protein